MLFVAKAELSLCICRVLSTQYIAWTAGEQSSLLLSPRANPDMERFRWCEEELENWRAKYALETLLSYSGAASKPILRVHDALLQMVFLTTSSALHRPRMLNATETDLRMHSRNKIQQAALEISSIAQVLSRQNLIRYLPITGVTVILLSVMAHLLDINSPDLSIQILGLQRFSQGILILQQLAAMYGSAELAISFLELAALSWGLSYTEFTLADLSINDPVPTADSIILELTVENRGRRSSVCVIQIYGTKTADERQYKGQFLGFTTVKVEAGGIEQVQVAASLRPFMVWNNERLTLTGGKAILEAGMRMQPPALICF
ncbi:hypothetical protein BJY01DRAFT_255058 [Aspergillus pseudoustus]|uniref:Fibronectin type III-like domain-containing protein n=1 Tax=Aspergillus pseudoustus TaxID=1810923 RepID=A0ABR4IR92_9EURO